MKRRTFTFPKSMSDAMADAKRAMDFYASSQVPPPDIFPPAREPRERRQAPKRSAHHNPFEADRQKAILAYLHRDPRVAWVGRFNRGAVVSEYRGKTSYVRMNTVKGFSDIHGMLKSGKPFYFETKRDGAYPTADQKQFLDLCAKHGAIACVVRCVEDAQNAIDAAR